LSSPIRNDENEGPGKRKNVPRYSGRNFDEAHEALFAFGDFSPVQSGTWYAWEVVEKRKDEISFSFMNRNFDEAFSVVFIFIGPAISKIRIT